MAFGSQAAVSEAVAALQKEQSAKLQAQGSLQRFWGGEKARQRRVRRLRCTAKRLVETLGGQGWPGGSLETVRKSSEQSRHRRISKA